MHFVRSARYLEAYRVLVEFEDGTRKVVDLERHLDGPIFAPLQDLAYFRLVSYNPDIETIVWPNDADFSPDFLYEIGTQAGTGRRPITLLRKPRAGVKSGKKASAGASSK